MGSSCTRNQTTPKLPNDINKAAETLHRSHMKSKAAFKRRFKHKLWCNKYKTGDLVLVRNSRVEKELYWKTKPQYLGPFEVLRQTQGPRWILHSQGNGQHCISTRSCSIPTLPYHAHEGIPLPIDDLHLDDLDDSDKES